LSDSQNRSNNSPVLACQGPSLGDSNGISRCDVVAVCQPAGTDFNNLAPFIVWAEIGEYVGHAITVTVTHGNASQLSLVSPTGTQIGNPTSSFTLVAQVTDGCGQAVQGVTVNWSITQGSASLGQVFAVSSGSGTVTARVTLGSTPGPIQVLVSAVGLSPVVFNLTNQVAVSKLAVLSGTPQSAAAGQPFPSPVVFVALDGNNNPVPGLVVNFAATLGATVNPASATTDAQGQAKTSVTAGSTLGTVVVTATYSSLSATASLLVAAPGPQISAASFTNAASTTLPGMTPCGLVTVIGNGLAPTPGVFTPLNNFGLLPSSLEGVSITVQQGVVNVAAPIQAVANVNGVQQVNFQAPCELAPGVATVAVTVNGATTTVQSVPVAVIQPGLFISSVSASNKAYGYVISEADGTIVTSANPAHRGQKYYVYVTGLGQATPTILTNTTGTGQNVNVTIVVGLNNGGVPVLSARYLNGSIGAYLVEFQIPPDFPLVNGQPMFDLPLAVAGYLNNGADGFSDYKFGNPLFLPAVE